MEVTAIVISRNRRDRLLRCLRHLRRLERPCRRVIVVDDASEDGTAAAVRSDFPEARVVRVERRLGPTAARNAGIRRAVEEGPFEAILFLDDDAFMEPGALKPLRDALATDPRVGIAVPKAYQDLEAGRLHLAGELEVDLGRARIRPVGAGEPDRGQHDVPRRIQACSGFAMLVRREALERLGGFDERFARPAWEDVDFALRCRDAGYEIAYVPAAVVEHVGGVLGRGALREREVAKVANGILLLRRHATAGQWALLLALLPFRAAGFLLRRVRGGDGGMLGAWLQGVWRGVRERRSV